MLQGKKTYLGLVVALLGVVLQQSGVELDAGDVDVIGQSLLTIGGLAFAAYGRYRAKPAVPVVQTQSTGEQK